MDNKQNRERKTVACIVAALNEGPRIGQTLHVLTQYAFEEIIVVSDGSTDNTVEIARGFDRVQVIDLTENQGKATAMEAGVAATKAEILFFADADLIGFTPKMIEAILEPVIHGRVDMCIGMRNRSFFLLHAVIEMFPLMGGERALTRALWEKIPQYYKHQYRIEAALNFYAKYYGHGFTARVFRNLSQVRKEIKLGFVVGWIKKLQMLAQVIWAELRLQNTAVPYEVVNIRRTLGGLFTSSFFATLGFLFILIANLGPQRITPYFEREMQQDSHAYLSQFVVWFVETFSATAIEIIGFILFVLNVIVVLEHMRRLLALLGRSKWTLKDVLLKRGNNEAAIFY